MAGDRQIVEVQYHCDTCDTDFVVYHEDQKRNSHCWWCGDRVYLTGQISRIEGDQIVVYRNGKQVAHRPRPSHGASR